MPPTAAGLYNQCVAGRQSGICELRSPRLGKLKHVPPNRLSEMSAKGKLKVWRRMAISEASNTRCGEAPGDAFLFQPDVDAPSLFFQSAIYLLLGLAEHRQDCGSRLYPFRTP